jgi:hypothetical protein
MNLGEDDDAHGHLLSFLCLRSGKYFGMPLQCIS